jgi:two-component system chemotaxis response regulator CheB
MQMETRKPIRVLAVDDSAVMRGVLRNLFQTQGKKHSGDLPAMELCGVVEDGVECLAAVLRLCPDVVVLDLEMPRMHGLDVLERLRLEEPGLPVIMCSSYTERGARSTLDALAMGAADYVMKPSQQSDSATAMETLASQLLPKIAVLGGAAFKMLSDMRVKTTQHAIAESKLSRSRSAAGTSTAAGSNDARIEIVVIGVSTGGPSALEMVLPRLAEDFAVPVMIVQHMPKLFTGELAERLDRHCALRVREARDGAEVKPGTIWLAPGDAHMEVAQGAEGSATGVGISGAVVQLHQQRTLNHCKPSVDYLFSSAARLYGAGTLALVMTGMGSDGLTGARRVHETGGVVLTQDETSSAVWGMPGRVFQAGLSREPLPLALLASELTRRVNAGRSVGTARETSAKPAITPSGNRISVSKPHPEVTHGLL